MNRGRNRRFVLATLGVVGFESLSGCTTSDDQPTENGDESSQDEDTETEEQTDEAQEDNDEQGTDHDDLTYEELDAAPHRNPTSVLFFEHEIDGWVLDTQNIGQPIVDHSRTGEPAAIASRTFYRADNPEVYFQLEAAVHQTTEFATESYQTVYETQRDASYLDVEEYGYADEAHGSTNEGPQIISRDANLVVHASEYTLGGSGQGVDMDRLESHCTTLHDSLIPDTPIDVVSEFDPGPISRTEDVITDAVDPDNWSLHRVDSTPGAVQYPWGVRQEHNGVFRNEADGSVYLDIFLTQHESPSEAQSEYSGVATAYDQRSGNYDSDGVEYGYESFGLTDRSGEFPFEAVIYTWTENVVVGVRRYDPNGPAYDTLREPTEALLSVIS